MHFPESRIGARSHTKVVTYSHFWVVAGWWLAACVNIVRLAVRAEPVEAHSPFDRLRANELKRTALRRALSLDLSLRAGTADARMCSQVISTK